MKKPFMFILLCIYAIYLIAGCAAQDLTKRPDVPSTIPAPNTLPPSVMLDDILYISTGEKIPIKVDENEILGKITSSISLTEWPVENGQTNLELLNGTPYAKYENGIIVRWGTEDAWMIFRNRDSIIVELEDKTSDTKSLDTLDEAMKWYLNEKHSHMFLEGDYFAASHRVLDVAELSDNVTIYAHILCEWITLYGEVISGGVGPIAITFKKNNGTYLYEKTLASGKEFFDSPEISQAIKDVAMKASYFEDLRSEVENELADFFRISAITLAQGDLVQLPKEATTSPDDRMAVYANIHPELYGEQDLIYSIYQVVLVQKFTNTVVEVFNIVGQDFDFIWSPDSRYVTATYSGRIWTQIDIIDTVELTTNSLTTFILLTYNYSDTNADESTFAYTPNENRPDNPLISHGNNFK